MKTVSAKQKKNYSNETKIKNKRIMKIIFYIT